MRRRTCVHRTCFDVAALVDDLVDGALDESRERAVRGHLRECPACAARVADTEAVVAAAADLGSLEPPPELWARLDQELDTREIRFSQKPRWWWWWQAWRRPLLIGSGLMAAAAAVVLAVGLRSRAPAPEAARAAVKVDPAALYEQALAAAARADRDYVTAIDDLRELARVERGHWPAQVAAELDRDLAVLDAVVVRQREAASLAPGDPAVQDALFASYRREIEVLEDAVVRTP